ncbi:MAG TPA: CHAT domain-containing protein, partial [Thermosynechococcaceae cyanobacterium]
SPRKQSRRLGYGFCFLFGVLLAFSISLTGIAQSSPPPLDQAQALNLQGQQQFESGDSQNALESWQQAEALYRQSGNQQGAIGTRLNQAKALQNLGFYRRANSLLEQILLALRSQPDSTLKANALLTYGNSLRLTGDLEASQRLLEESLAIAQGLQSAADVGAAQLHLGNTLLAQHQDLAALRQFETAAAQSGSFQIPAQLRQLRLLQQLDRAAEANTLFPKTAAQLSTLPLSQTSIYAQIELAALSPKSPHSLQAAQLLTTAAQQAKTLGDRRAESYAIGRLGQVYEQSGQWTEAKQLTESALRLARTANVPEIIYQWQWQVGRILKAQGNVAAATNAYTQAVTTLQSLRQDLVAVGQDVQFSFRDQVEPVYRGLVDLLLQPSASQDHLKQARQVIESLQLAELNNFFREACVEGQPRQVDDIDPTAAVIYPVILPDRLEVILSLPGQSLRHYATALSQTEIEAGVERMVRSMRSTSFAAERLAVAQQLYRWLIRPILLDLEQQKIKTLVFVLDGSLRNVPMAALHDGKQYLIEQYQLALTPGLQLLSPRPLQREQMRALLSGLSQGMDGSAPLPEVQQEIDQIKQLVPSTVLLNQSFTTQSFQNQVNAAPYTVVHLATHGQFSSQASQTYVQTWDGRLDVNALQALLNQRSTSSRAAIELLVLSACQTAEGDNRAILGMAGMAVRAGARSTIATLWAVNDESTATFATQFYKALTQSQVNKAEAVRQAQLSLIQSSRFKHPYFWASYTLIGNWL